MNLRDKIESNPLSWILRALLAGFVAGLATYEAILRIAQLEVVPRARVQTGASPASAKPATQLTAPPSSTIAVSDYGVLEFSTRRPPFPTGYDRAVPGNPLS